MEYNSIITSYCENVEFLDKKTRSSNEAIDVIIPIFNTNALFEQNLISIYREIPVNQLIIGDGGCTDDSIEILKKFPRVKIIDQSDRKSLGHCIAEMIDNVETDWFVYLHSDVYLPDGWYESMKKNQGKYDWFECDSRLHILIEQKLDLRGVTRAYSGSQMGRKKAFEKIVPKIDDDYLYRNEDIIFHELILAEGYKYGRVFDTFHYHQIMNKKGEKEPKFKHISIERLTDKDWEIRTNIMQVKGLIKYLKPKKYLIRAVNKPIWELQKYNAINENDFKDWVKETNPDWLKYLKFKKKHSSALLNKVQVIILYIYNKIFN